MLKSVLRTRLTAAAVAMAISLAMTLTFTTAATAQEGHPLKGSWIGFWESNDTHGDNVIVILDWDGERISGIINPGTDNIEIDNATLDPADWSVQIEADTVVDGLTVRYVIEGTIQDLELPNRYIVGTWRNRNDGGDFEIRRQ